MRLRSGLTNDFFRPKSEFVKPGAMMGARSSPLDIGDSGNGGAGYNESWDRILYVPVSRSELLVYVR